MECFYYASGSPLPVAQQVRPWSFATSCQQAIAEVTPLVLGASPQLTVDCGSGVQELNAVFVIEVVFEHIRAAEFKHRPSRWQTVHLFGNEADSVEFAMRYWQHRTRPYIYEIMVRDPAAVFRADQVLLNEGPNFLADPQVELEQMKERARKYWDGQRGRIPFMEVLAPAGDAEVRRLVRILDKRAPIPAGQAPPNWSASG